MIPQVVTDFVLQWVLPFSIVFGSFFLLVRMINLAYRRTDLDRLYSIGISIGVLVGIIFIVYVTLKNAGYLDKMHSIWNLIYNSAFVVGIRLKLNAMFGNYWIIIINFLKKWVGLKEEDHTRSKKIFNPKESLQNTQTWLKYRCNINEIKYIEKELKDYLYDFSPTAKKNN